MERLRPSRFRVTDDCRLNDDVRDIPPDLREERKYWRECAEENFENLVDASYVGQIGEE